MMRAAVGGQLLPGASDTVVVRWLGNANYEVTFGGKVFLFDAYFDRVARSRPIGFAVPDVRKADAILVSHAHFDHISDIGPVARQTGATVVGAPITIETAIKLGVPAQQTKVVKGGETLHFGDVAVETALARHSTIQDGLVGADGNLEKVETRPDTPEEAAHTKDVRARGTFAPEVIDKGTLAFALVLRNGFSIVVIGSAGPITDGDRELAKKLGRADVAIVAYQPHAVAARQIVATWLDRAVHPAALPAGASRPQLRRLARSRSRAAVSEAARREAGHQVRGPALSLRDLHRHDGPEARKHPENPLLSHFPPPFGGG